MISSSVIVASTLNMAKLYDLGLGVAMLIPLINELEGQVRSAVVVSLV